MPRDISIHSVETLPSAPSGERSFDPPTAVLCPSRQPWNRTLESTVMARRSLKCTRLVGNLDIYLCQRPAAAAAGFESKHRRCALQLHSEPPFAPASHRSKATSPRRTAKSLVGKHFHHHESGLRIECKRTKLDLCSPISQPRNHRGTGTTDSNMPNIWD